MKLRDYIMLFLIAGLLAYAYIEFRATKQNRDRAIELSYTIDSLNHLHLIRNRYLSVQVRRRALDYRDSLDNVMSLSNLEITAWFSDLLKATDLMLSRPKDYGETERQAYRNSLNVLSGKVDSIKHVIEENNWRIELPEWRLQEWIDGTLRQVPDRLMLVRLQTKLMEVYTDLSDYFRYRVGPTCGPIEVVDFLYLNEDPHPGAKTHERIDHSYIMGEELPYRSVKKAGTSNFPFETDFASYHNLQLFLSESLMPVTDQIKTEELINYFDYEYEEPEAGMPFRIHTALSACPWNESNQLLMIGIKGKTPEAISNTNSDPKNYTILLDITDEFSMDYHLALFRSGLKTLVGQLKAGDKIAIVSADQGGKVHLPATDIIEKKKITAAIESLPGNSNPVNKASLQFAHQLCKASYVDGGENYLVVLSDDNSYSSNLTEEKLETLTADEEEGVTPIVANLIRMNYLSKPLKDLFRQAGGRFYEFGIQQQLNEVFRNGFRTEFDTIARNVKMDVKFHSALTDSFRLIGYEDRTLLFNDYPYGRMDRRDITSGFELTVLYELIPAERDSSLLKKNADVFGKVEIQYQHPVSNQKMMITENIKTRDLNTSPGRNFQLSSAVAAFSLRLRDSRYKGSADYDDILRQLEVIPDLQEDPQWRDFYKLVKTAQQVSSGYEWTK